MNGTQTWPTAILLVDDDELMLEMMQDVLADTDYEIVRASAAAPAIDIVYERPLAAVVTDKNLPDGSGLDIIAATVQRQPHCACILLTAYASADSAVEALRLGAADYVTKPLESVDLFVEQLNRAIHKQRSVHQARLLERRVRSIRGELAERDERLQEMASQMALLEGMLKGGESPGLPDPADPGARTEALETTYAMARDLVTYTKTLVTILNSEGDEKAAIDNLNAAARKLDSHLDIIDYLAPQ